MEQARTPKVSDKNLQLSNSNSNVRQNSLSWTFGTFTPPSPSLSLLLALDCLAPAQTQFIVTHFVNILFSSHLFYTFLLLPALNLLQRRVSLLYFATYLAQVLPGPPRICTSKGHGHFNTLEFDKSAGYWFLFFFCSAHTEYSNISITWDIDLDFSGVYL